MVSFIFQVWTDQCQIKPWVYSLTGFVLPSNKNGNSFYLSTPNSLTDEPCLAADHELIVHWAGHSGQL